MTTERPNTLDERGLVLDQRLALREQDSRPRVSKREVLGRHIRLGDDLEFVLSAIGTDCLN